MSALPAPRRVVTNHDSTGKAIVWRDDAVNMRELPGSTTQGGLVWLTDSFPANVQTNVDAATLTPAGIAHPSGSVLRFVDMPPGASFPLHFTDSIDYGVVISGESTLELPGDVFTTLKPGDTVVQLGTVHAWHNRTDQWSRVLFVVLPSHPVVVNGNPLGGLHL